MLQRDLGDIPVLRSGLYIVSSVNRIMIVKSVVTSIIWWQMWNTTLTDPSFIGSEFARCDVEWDIMD